MYAKLSDWIRYRSATINKQTLNLWPLFQNHPGEPAPGKNPLRNQSVTVTITMGREGKEMGAVEHRRGGSATS